MAPSIERFQRLRELFAEAVAIEPSARGDYLDGACGDDPALRADVVRLLAAHEEAGPFLEQPAGRWPGDADDGPFSGTDRFRVVRQLGAGGMGVVYEVQDGVRGDTVALKTLRRTTAANVYRLKQEFRSLADVTHPNLACLYELFVEDDRGFFTMELVRGVSFVDYVRDGAAGAAAERLVDALRQLIAGLSALHQRGKLHRDIKPSNVLVTREGRVVILDFGLIAEVAARHAGEARYVRGGTPAYMSPEEAAGAAPSDASDWYGVGVTLYEGLTGRIPFEGHEPDILLRKRTSDPLPPMDVASGPVGAELNAICMGLLHRDPGLRLTGSAVLARLTGGVPREAAAPVMANHDPPFVGRDGELRALHDAYAAVTDGHARLAAVHGPSGIGKSALVRHFVGDVAGRGEAVVLTGRCYENEAVPYKALDGIIDDLSHYLGSLPRAEVAALVPPDVVTLTRLFPVLLQVPAVAAACRDRPFEAVDPQRLRRQAFDAFAALLRVLARRQPLLIWIDDMQWADADSIVLLDELLGAADPPAVLTMLSFRSEESAGNPFLQSLRDRAHPALFLEPMTESEAHALIRGLLRQEDDLTDRDARQMTQEAAGSPFVLEQLAIHAGGGGRERQTPTFAHMFATRLEALSPGARQFLSTLAVCGRPMAPEIVWDACGIAHDRQSLVVMLRAARLIRSSGSSARVETYHDRIREVLVQRLAADAVRGIHGRMAGALVARRSDDCEALFEHYRGAGDAERAGVQAGLAAARAADALAFDRAATLYGDALDLAPAASQVQAWREGLANALVNAGRPAAAAEAYLQAAAGTQHARQVELRRRAAEQFLTGGYIDRGLELIRDVLERVGLSAARTPRRAMLSLVWRRARLGWRGPRFFPRRSEDVDPDLLLRLDTCWVAATGLALVDTITACDFIARHLQMALDAGEPSRIARGMALESAARHADRPFRRGGVRLATRAAALAREVGTPQALALELLAESIAAAAVGEWARALRASERSLALLRDRCVNVAWELTIAENIVIWALMYLGEIGEVSRRVPPILADARRRGNLYLATELCTRSNYVWLAADDPDGGEREAAEAMERWSSSAYHRQHYSATLARVQTALYRGDGDAAWRILEGDAAKVRGSLLTRVQVLRIEWHFLRARSALTIAAASPSPRFLSLARMYTRRIAGERMPWSEPIAFLLEAGIAAIESRQADALRRLEEATPRFDRAGMQLYAAVSRRRIGALRGDEQGRAARQQADVWMAGQQIRNATAMTRMLSPGFPD